jgi:hypothetical protein
MKASLHLFDLIKSLTPSEKRHFKLFTSRHVIGEKNNYTKLFDAVEKLDQYDEDKLKKTLKDESLVRNLAYEKNYLYSMISDSLHVYHLNLSRESELRKQLHLIGIFFDKGLYAHCHKLVKKVMQTGEELERYNYVYEALLWKKKLMAQKSYSGIREKELKQVFDETLQVTEKIKNQTAYANLSEMLRYLIDTSGQIRSKEQKKKFDKVIKDPLLKRENEALSNAGKRMYNSIWMNYHFYTNGNLKSIVAHTSRELSLLEDKPVLIEENPGPYIGVLGNIIITLLEQRNYIEASRYLDKLRSLPETLKNKLRTNLQIRIFVLLYSQELTLFIESGAFEKVHGVIGDIEEGFQLYEGKISKTNAITIYYNLVYLYIGTGEFRKALKWLNRILQYKDLDAREDIVCFSKILQLIIYFELNDTDALPHVFKSTYRYLTKRKRVYQGETVILNFIKKASGWKTQGDVLKAYVQLKKEFEKLAKNTFEKNLFIYFDFISWLQSKLEKKDFATIIRQKAL